MSWPGFCKNYYLASQVPDLTAKAEGSNAPPLPSWESYGCAPHYVELGGEMAAVEIAISEWKGEVRYPWINRLAIPQSPF